MRNFEFVLFGLLALGWIVMGLRAWRGMSQIPRISQTAPKAGQHLPRISILFAARNEAEKLPAALASFVSLDYPDYQIIAVDDRSLDATPQTLDNFASQHSILKVVHISALPEGWLGKPHALETAYERSSGEWLVFTDADVRFAPDLIRRALALAELNNWDHLTLLAAVELRGFWETTAVGYLGVGFVFGAQPWRVSDPRTGSYMGVGAFQLIRRSTYEAIGTHRRLAMEVVDDMKLGKLVKQHGFRSGIAVGEDFVQVRWQEGIRNVIRGLTKNLFAAFGFRIWQALGGMLGIFLISILPFLGLFFTEGWTRGVAGASVVIGMSLQARLLRENSISPLYGITHPLGAAIFIYMILRSMTVTLWQGGIIWRGTFYRLEDLRKGLV